MVIVVLLSAAVRTVVVPRDEQVLLNRVVVPGGEGLLRECAKRPPYKDSRSREASRRRLPREVVAGRVDNRRRGGFSELLGAAGAAIEHALVLAGSSATTIGFERSDGSWCTCSSSRGDDRVGWRLVDLVLPTIRALLEARSPVTQITTGPSTTSGHHRPRC